MKENIIDTTLPNDIFSSAFLFGNVGAPFAIGLAVGYFAKKMLKTALFLGGAAIVLLFVSEYYGIVEITDAMLEKFANSATDAAKSSGDFLVKRLNLASFSTKSASGAGGFFVGFKVG
jgi:uncharacterized membrane protein (Fun14 family)